MYGSAVQWPYRIDATGVVPWDAGGWVDRTLVIGGFDDQAASLSSPISTAPEREAENTVWQITNPLGAGATWTIPPSYGAMARRRVYCNSVLMPDLKLIVFGGSEYQFCPYDSGGTQVASEPVYEPEQLDLLNPAAGWQLLAPHASARLYHSVALLLKDGRILVGSGYKATVNSPALTHSDAELFTPPCLQQGLPRPTITNLQSQIENLQYGNAFPSLGIALQGSTNPATEIEFATLIRCGAATHHFDADQRCIKLEVTAAAGRNLQLAPIPSQQQGGHFVVPPGWYYLFVVTTPRGNPLVRVPSVARFVHIH